ncbi:hypothetical protein OA2633_07224 [Oceanicaulis sp. HTCC2633]|jgi:hypothetical protein|uniref:hypothetical protein n=1 Tax=Oceanicaulis sp. HTCC2633 TaxID=314254 RepID=UPI000066A28F|nr:hypothetical protein [Oceanicaulis sp. HTCC2633]EAP89985.1 hypothetical protein OA2633_07224 [Oceanicaulis sp. HTCC2633]
MTLEDRIAREVARQIAPLNEVLNQIWAQMQAEADVPSPPIPDPPIPDPSIPDPSIPQTPIPDTPIDLPPIPGLGAQSGPGGARPSTSQNEAEIRQQLERATQARQQEQSAAIARRTAMIQARIARKLNAFQR